MLRTLAVAVLLAGCVGVPSGPAPTEPAPGTWDLMPSLFVSEAWNQTIRYNAAEAPAQEVGFVWSAVQLQRDTPLDSVNRQAVASNLNGPWEIAAQFVAPPETGTIHVGTYIILEGHAFITPYQAIQILPYGKVHTITIGEVPLGPLSQWGPPVLEIAVGDGIAWDNLDAVAHRPVSHLSSRWTAFDTGNIPAGETSRVVYFREAADIAYGCVYHPGTMAEAVLRVNE